MKRTTMVIGCSCLSLVFLCGSTADCPAATVGMALKLSPVQRDVDFDRPTEEQAPKCTIQPNDGVAGHVVATDSGQVLRKFLDTNNDGDVDMWCYFKNGVEVYRDVDSDFNRKADQYRWLGTAGTRWGIDDNEDGQIDTWKTISPEEVTEEIVNALRQKDSKDGLQRFKRILLTPAELDKLGLGSEQAEELSGKIGGAAAAFNEIKSKQKVVLTSSEWVHFGGSRPGIVPAGVNGATKDVIIYDNVSAVVETAGKHAEVRVGTLVRVGDGWRVIDAPRALIDNDPTKVGVSFFFQTPVTAKDGYVATGGKAISQDTQKLITDLEKLEKELQKGGSKKAYDELSIILEKLITAAPNAEEKSLWTRQFADRISAVVQDGTYPDGVERLRRMYIGVADDKQASDVAAYVKFRYVSAEYGLKISQEDADHAKIQEEWLKTLSEFVDEYPTSNDAPEAMLQLAIAEEFAGKDKEALKWYARIDSDFHGSEVAKKAIGAKRRLESVGKLIDLRGKTLDGKDFVLASLKGRPVLIHYWDTRCTPCKKDMELLKKVQAKFAGQNVVFVGVNLDTNVQAAIEHVRTARITWPQLQEKGGLEGRLATEMGIFTLPTMILLDKQGKVVNRSITAGEVEGSLAKMLK